MSTSVLLVLAAITVTLIIFVATLLFYFYLDWANERDRRLEQYNILRLINVSYLQHLLHRPTHRPQLAQDQLISNISSSSDTSITPVLEQVSESHL